jgi:hypothetical protein
MVSVASWARAIDGKRPPSVAPAPKAAEDWSSPRRVIGCCLPLFVVMINLPCWLSL